MPLKFILSYKSAVYELSGYRLCLSLLYIPSGLIVDPSYYVEEFIVSQVTVSFSAKQVENRRSIDFYGIVRIVIFRVYLLEIKFPCAVCLQGI